MVKQASQAAVEADGALQAALEKIKELSYDLETVKAQNIRLRAQLQSIENGIFVAVVE